MENPNSLDLASRLDNQAGNVELQGSLGQPLSATSANGMVRPCSSPCQQAKLARGAKDQGARHVTQAQCWNRRDRYRYWQELVSRCGSRSARRDRPAPEVVAWPSI